MNLQGNIVDVVARRIFPGEINIANGRIEKVRHLAGGSFDTFILPGFTDAHVHIESSMLVPSEFARLAVIHGTVATVSDPHEIANVMGIAGVNYMIENGNQVPFHFNFGAPSCVPATIFETAGATLNAKDVEQLLERKEIKYLSEMMNYPGVISGDTEVMKKIACAQKVNKPVDGHAPGLTGEAAIKYMSAGSSSLTPVISTDHECFTYEEGLFKIQHGMKVLIREGSAAKNFDTLIPLLGEYPEMVMFCSDDKHPNDLVRGHINQLVKRALSLGIDFWNIIRAATFNPVMHYQLDCGLLREGDSADFIVVNDLTQWNTFKTYVKGIVVAENGMSFIEKINTCTINNFYCNEKNPVDFKIFYRRKNLTPPEKDSLIPEPDIKVIEAHDGQLITKTHLHPISKLINSSEELNADIENDVLKITVVNRYSDASPAVAFIKNIGLKNGAIASCVGHDSHNIIAAGVSDEMICKAVNAIINSKGGLSAVSENEQLVLPLPVAGIMTNADAWEVAAAYEEIDAFVKKLGSTLTAPFMSLSFMALLVIPQLKLSDKGLFDGSKFEFTPLAV